MILLSVKNVGKSFRKYKSDWHRFANWFGLKIKPVDEAWVLRNINLDIHAGESIGIIGQNGAGKSTLLKILTGTLQATEGNILNNGRISAILELGMGFNPDLTGRQNVFNHAGLMGFSNEQITMAMPGIEAFSEIGTYFNQPVRVYSSGMQMRVAFAVATAYRPDILIIDEALAVGDVFFQAKCYDRIKKFKEKGTLLILVTHSVDEIVKHCNRAIYIKDGKIKLDGSPRDVGNVYMDDLFSDDKDKKVNQTNHKSTNSSMNLMKDSSNSFKTRQGYRKDEYNWGDGGARIIDFLIHANNQDYPLIIESNTITEFSFKVIFDEEFNDITAGIQLKTLEGLVIYGTNSFYTYNEARTLPVQKGDIKIFKFTSELSLNAGSYLLSFGVSSGPQEMLKPLHRRYDSVLINIGRSNSIVGIVDLKSKFEIIN